MLVPAEERQAGGTLLTLQVKARGANLSQGQRQLLCLCRALLSRARVVCVDEAGANLDVASDAIMRRTIAEVFRHATVITVAHRLSTLVELCTRVIVMAEGRVVEMGEPRTLLKDPNSHFSRLARDHQIQTSL
jgi:ABC-type multidrug transport system fused ATPase/permease subunit